MKLLRGKHEKFLFFLLLIFYLYFFNQGGWDGCNPNTRLDLVYSIVNENSLSIDSYHENTCDKAFFNSHYYSDKAPGASLLAVPVYFALKPVEFVNLSVLPTLINILPVSIKIVTGITNTIVPYLIRIILVSIPSAFLAVLLYRFLSFFTKNEKYKLFLPLAYALGTLAFPYSTLFYGHQISALLSFAAFYLLFKMRHSGKISSQQLFFSGLLAGYSFITEYLTFIISILLFFYALSFVKNRKLFLLVLGFVPPLIILLIYNFLTFGNPLYLGYMFVEETANQGFLGSTYPTMYKLYGTLFSSFRGLFYLSPFLLLSIPSFYFFWKVKKHRREFFFCLISIVAFVLWNSSYHAWEGGWALGPRHLVPVLPYLTFPIIFFLNNNGKYIKQLKFLFYFLAIVSIIFVLIGVTVDSQPSFEFTSPLTHYLLPSFLKGQFHSYNFGNLLNLRGLLSLLPLAMFLFFMFVNYMKRDK